MSLKTDPVLSPRFDPPGQYALCVMMWSMRLPPGRFPFRCLRPGFEAIAVVAGLKDVAAMGRRGEQGSGHLGVTEVCRPFAEAEAQVGDGDHAGPLAEFTEQMEQLRAT